MPKNIYHYGTPNISTTQYKFGTSSGYFITNEYLYTDVHDDFNFGAGDFTIDFWFRTTDNTKTQYFYTQTSGSSDNSIAFGRTLSSITFYVRVNASFIAYYTVSDSISNNTWYHYELVRHGSNIYIFKDGTGLTLTETTPIGSQAIPNFTATPMFCAVVGYVDEFRVSNGIARHTSNFSVATEVYTYDTYTKLLLHFNGANGVGVFLDNAFGQILTHICVVRLLQYTDVKTSEVGTTTTNIKITGHGLSTGDFIVNTSIRSDEQNATERGSRRITVVDANNLTCPVITGQSSNNDIRLYHFTDISSYIDLNSINLNLVAEEQNSFTFTMSIPTDSVNGIDILPSEGQYIEVGFDSVRWYAGIISNTSRKLSNNIDNITLSITCMALKNRAYTRTVSVNYASGTATGTIVNQLATYLIQEGFEIGVIETGINLSEAWANDIISVGEALDELAEKNGFQWLIDSAYKLYFFKDIAITSYRDIVQDGEFADFRDVAINSNINDYRNKIYFVGGNDPSGCVVKNIKGSSVEQNYKQAITAGSGIYGEVIRNSSETSRWSYTATTGTTATNITITGHDAVVRAYFKNRTRNLTGFVTGVTDANNFTCTSIAGQTAGDVISFYWDAYNISTIELRRTKNQPLELTFQTLDLTFRPQMRIYINLPILNIEASYWNIESVQITDVGRGYFSQIVTCVLSDGSDFNSQGRRNKDLDFFRRW